MMLYEQYSIIFAFDPPTQDSLYIKYMLVVLSILHIVAVHLAVGIAHTIAA